jgi:hypothetical protein
VGHLRSTIIGDTLARVLELRGHPVIRLNHVRGVLFPSLPSQAPVPCIPHRRHSGSEAGAARTPRHTLKLCACCCALHKPSRSPPLWYSMAKAMHCGHFRSTILGDTLACVLKLRGHPVIRLNHVRGVRFLPLHKPRRCPPSPSPSAVRWRAFSNCEDIP